ncbi:Bumetanide-sensitive sodium-(potassium)-chloride cotransporter [Blattella germanica]|nr:Bumetanide-sensitive sodium-(potassium)-chloride cotransporter [Blattella germanica]
MAGRCICGIYYMISRSLGPEFGGAIGLMFTLANSVAVSMYIVGFCESLQDLLRTSFGIVLIDGDTNDIRVVGLITLIGILVLAIIGMDWVTRVIETFKENLKADYRYYEGVDHDFFSVFAVFFPAVTGIVAGANLSGDLKDPSSAIPIGTILAIIVTFVSYIGYAFMMGGCVLRTASGNVTEFLQVKGTPDEWSIFSNCTDRSCPYGLQNDSQAMELASSWGPLIYGGCFAATLSSAIASLVGAPRVLQALAKDKLYPLIGFFSKGHGANNDPVRGYVLVFIISFGCILIAQLNAIAPLLSNFFLAAYALINFSVFHASISKSPGWRPAFRYYNAWVSLVGTLLCIAVMFLMSWVMALITFVVVITLYLYVSYRKPDVNWGSSTQAHSYSSALKAMIELNRVEEHVKNFRPQILALTGMPGTRPPLGNHSQRVHDALTRKAYHWLIKHKVKAFFNITEDNNFEDGAWALMQISGLGKLRPNMVLMGYKSNWRTCDREELKQYFNVIHNALDRYLAVGILRLPEGLDYSGVIEDEEFVPIQTLDKKDAEEKLRRNQSTSQFTSQGVTMNVLSETLSSDTDSPPSSPKQKHGDAVNCDPTASETLLESGTAVTVTSKKQRSILKKQKSTIVTYYGPGGEPLAKPILDNITQFRRKQPKGLIDVWWLYDDGGLTLLIPYILSTRSQFSGCQLRIFSLASKGDDLAQDQRNDVVIIPDINKKAQESTVKEFEILIEPFKEKNTEDKSKVSKQTYITDSELLALKEKSNRHMRIRELLLQYSKDSTFVVMALPIPRKDVVSAPLYMAWLELITKGMPPYLIIRGNQTSVITFYS